MGNLSGFDANKVDPSGAMPKGKYAAIFVADEEKVSKSNSANRFLELTCQVTKGRFQNRKLKARLNLWNSNATAAQIAQAELSAICRAIGVPTPDSSSELLNKPLVIVVGCREYEGRPQNEVIGFEPLTDGFKPDETTATANVDEAPPAPPEHATVGGAEDDEDASPF